MNWLDCERVEVVPGKVSGVPLIKGTRVPVDTIIENRDLDPDEIADQFSLSVADVCAVLAFWQLHQRAA